MTTLNKTVKRKVEGLLRKPITVILYPHGTIGFQEYRSRTVYTLPVMTAYNMAVRAAQMEAKKKKADAKKIKREARGILRGF